MILSTRFRNITEKSYHAKIVSSGKYAKQERMKRAATWEPSICRTELMLDITGRKHMYEEETDMDHRSMVNPTYLTAKSEGLLDLKKYKS